MAPLGVERITVNVLAVSTAVSLVVAIVIVWLITPAANVSVPALAV